MKAKKTWLGPVLIAAVFGGTLFLVFREQSPGAVAAALGQVYPGYIALGLALMFCFVGWEALASCLTLRRLGQRAPYVRCLGYSFTGFVFSSITPSSSGGQPAQVYEMTRDGIPVAHGALVMLLNAVCYQTATLVLAVAALVWHPDFLGELGGGLGFLLGTGTAVMVFLTGGMLGFLFAPRPAAWLARHVLGLGARLHLVDRERAQRRLARQMEEYRRGAQCLRRTPSLFPRLLGLSLLQLISLYLVPGVVYCAFGLTGRSVAELVAMQAILSLAVGFLPLPGAVGASEGAFLRGYALFFGSTLVAPAMLISRGISFYSFLFIAGGITVALHLRRRSRAPAKGHPAMERAA